MLVKAYENLILSNKRFNKSRFGGGGNDIQDGSFSITLYEHSKIILIIIFTIFSWFILFINIKF